MMTDPWQLLGVLLTAVSALVGLSTAYLRLFVSGELWRAREAILEAMRQQYANREVTYQRFANIERRLDLVEKNG